MQIHIRKGRKALEVSTVEIAYMKRGCSEAR